jgi:dienelactone hydrolase
MRVSFIPFLLCLFVVAFAQPVRAQDAVPSRLPEFVQEATLLPVTIGGATFRLEVLVVRSRTATGRLPIALVTHGKPGPRDDLATIHATTYRGIARDLARRGWLAVVVVRRGYGFSEGSLPQFGDCRSGYDLARMFRTEALDLAGVLSVVANRPDADATRAIAVGVSAGGAATLAFAASAPANLKAVINVSGGLRNDTCPYEGRLVETVAGFGRTTKIPTLWVYARNDRLFGPDLVEKMRAAFVSAGGDARLSMVDPLGDDGHALFNLTEGRTRWYAALDAFLRDVGLPTLGDHETEAVMALGLEAGQRPSVARYLAVPGEKALARPVGGGKLTWFLGQSDVATARRLALELCEKTAPKCEIVAENNRAAANPVAANDNAMKSATDAARKSLGR